MISTRMQNVSRYNTIIAAARDRAHQHEQVYCDLQSADAPAPQLNCALIAVQEAWDVVDFWEQRKKVYMEYGYDKNAL